MMKRFFTLAITLTLSTILFSQEKYSKIKIYANSADLQFLAENGVGIDHGNYKKNTFFISDFSQRDIATIQNLGFQVDVLIDDVTKYYQDQNLIKKTYAKANNCDGSGGGNEITSPTNWHTGTMGGYYKYQEFLDELDEMQAAYPNLITAKAPISDTLTHEGRPVYFVKISDNPNTDEVEEEVLYSSIHHAREPASLSQTIYYMWYLLENYGTNDEITYLVDNLEMYFVPMINPDGYVHNEVNEPNGGGMHRKNKRNVGSSNPGVDLNRNYSYQWGTTGVDFDPDSDTYPGTGAFSEPETQNMKKLTENHDFVLAFNAHTHGDLLLFPVGATNEEFAADHDYLQTIGNHMTEENGFFAQKSSGLYPASGDSDDYMYLDHGVLAHTPEVGPSFWPASSQIEGICQSTLFMNLKMAHLALNYAVTKETDPGEIDEMTGHFHYTIQRLGQQDGSFTVSMEALTGIQTLGTDNNYPTLILEDVKVDSISYVLDPAIQNGDEVKYVLKTNNGLWTKNDTITKVYGSAPEVFVDNANNLNNWTTSDWSTTNSTYYSASTSITDSPNGNYSNDVSAAIELTDAIDLSTATTAKAEFYAKWEIETDWDYVTFEVSTDNGANWQQLCGKYTNEGVEQIGWGGQNQGIQPVGEPLYDGFQSDWVFEEVDLSDYVGQTIKLRFYIQTDGASREDGFYYDDFKILHDGTIGLTENNKTQLNVYPNPTKDVVNFVLAEEFVSNGKIKLMDNTGRVVRLIAVNSNNTQVNVEDLPEGVYFYQYENGTISSEVERLVIMK